MNGVFLNSNRLTSALFLFLLALAGCTSNESSFSPNVLGPKLSFSVVTQGQNVDIDTFSFGATGSSTIKILELWNNGDWEAIIEELSITPPFSFTGGNFPGTGGTCERKIAAKTSCTLSLTYSPGGESSPVGSFAITYVGLNYRKTLTVHFSVQSGELADSGSGGAGGSGGSGGSGGGGGGGSLLPAPQFHPTIPILPNAGPLAGGTVVVILGSGFQSGATVTLGGNACTPVNFLSATSLSCPTPSHLSGAASVALTVLNPDGQTFTLPNAYTYNEAPTMASTDPIQPPQGPLAGGNRIAISGTGFFASATITVGGLPCISVIMNMAGTLISCLAPPHLVGSYAVELDNPDGQTVSLPNGYTYNAFPTLGGFALGSPTSGALAGGTLITIQGTGFLSGGTLTIGGTPCSPTTIISPTRLTCLTPPHVAGNYNVVFANSDGQSGTLGSTFAYNGFPTLAGSPLSPTSGPLAGGTALTISGSGFLPGAGVRIGGTSCLNIVVVSNGIITCNSPAHAAGSYDLLVTNADTQSASRANTFTYNIAPSFGAIPVTPSSGPLAGGTPIMISGSGFLSGATVTIGGLACTNAVALTATTISCDTPAHLAGSHNIVVTNPDMQTNTLVNGFTYVAPPSFSGMNPISPAFGPLAGGTAITISGGGFINGATVTIGGASCITTTFISSSIIGCVTPVGSAGSANVVVANPDLQSVTLLAGFTYNPAPTFGGGSPVSPSNGPALGGTVITISGSGFLDGATISIANIACSSVVFNSASSISCTTAGGSTGFADIKITNPDGQFVILANGFTYNAPPTLSVVAPNQGPGIGGTAVTLTGTGFVSGATATFGGTTCVNPVVVNATTFTCTTPAHAGGAVAVVVTNPDGQPSTLAGGFTFIAAPMVASVVRSAGALAGGTAVTVNGSGFISGATVEFGGVACANPVVVSANAITCTTGAHSAGAVPVTVTNPDLQAGVLASAYVYQPAPVVSGINPATGPSSGGTWVTITGQNFLIGATVSFGGTAASWVSFVNSTTLQTSTPVGTVGPVVIRVTNADTQYGENANLFTYTISCGAPAPASAPFAGGNGTVQTPYLLSNVAELNEVRRCPGHHYRMTNDIDLTGVAFMPIATFSGSFNGDGHTISNFTFIYPAPSVDISGLGSFGLFASSWSGSFRNLSMSNVNIDVTVNGINTIVGALVGQSAATFENIHILSGLVRAATATAQYAVAGGVVGWGSNATFTNCSTNLTTKTQNGSGQNSMAGAMVGGMERGNITDSFTTGTTTATTTSGQNAVAGGMTANFSAWGAGTNAIQRSFTSGSISSHNQGGSNSIAAGFSAWMSPFSSGTIEVTDCYSTATLTSTTGVAWGSRTTAGIVGSASPFQNGALVLTNVYTTGVQSGTTKGGLIASVSNWGSPGTVQVNSSYWNTETTGTAVSAGGGTGVTSALMLLQSTFVGWDFINIWTSQAPSPVLQ